MEKKKNAKAQLKERFDIIKDDLGKGGNGTVSLARDKRSGEEVALKVLFQHSKEKKQRFSDEIRVVETYYDSIPGLIPIIEACPEEFWYTMPVAEAIMAHIEKAKLTVPQIAEGIIQLAQTLSQLHEHDVSHRDIKPDNILFYDGRFCLSDFGLASFPEHPEGLTKSDKGIGAIFTIAPEMKRDPKHADGKKADVFSLAKTTWMLLTGDTRGFDGVYDPFDPSHSLRNADRLSDVHLVELERLLTASTNNDPALRPDMEAFRDQMIEWLEISQDDARTQASEWNFINQYLFGENMPQLAVWRERDAIVRVLNAVGRLRALNHMLFSDKGGLDFQSAERAAEEGCICIADTLGFLYIVKPEFLRLETFGEDYVWNYFLLRFSPLEPILEGERYGDGELLVEDRPGHYVSAKDSVYGVYDYDTGEKLPEGSRTVNRYLAGAFLIVLKGSPYNGIPATYDGRHGQCDAERFRAYMDFLRQAYHVLRDRGISREAILDAEFFQKNPFEPEQEDPPETPPRGRRPDEYIEANFLSWSFKDIMPTPGDGNIAFFFSFRLKNGGSIAELIRGCGYYLCADGQIRADPPEDAVYYISDRAQARQIEAACEERVAELCRSAGFACPDVGGARFTIHLKRRGKPTHLFTREEIETLMRGADDREHNMLVIDEDGRADIIQDINLGSLYPVCHESWVAGNNYVGKYSSLSSLDDTYLASLQGWLSYLQSGRRQRMDYLGPEQDVDALIQEIGQYY